mmetsp:Transcript_33191/g.96798  ORF Transcript_33191/g.96798 Transcript_33191/m.96798 type:complete len:333 (-) Transcript_33191:764-1762(-)
MVCGAAAVRSRGPHPAPGRLYSRERAGRSQQRRPDVLQSQDGVLHERSDLASSGPVSVQGGVGDSGDALAEGRRLDLFRRLLRVHLHLVDHEVGHEVLLRGSLELPPLLALRDIHDLRLWGKAFQPSDRVLNAGNWGVRAAGERHADPVVAQEFQLLVCRRRIQQVDLHCVRAQHPVLLRHPLQCVVEQGLGVLQLGSTLREHPVSDHVLASIHVLVNELLPDRTDLGHHLVVRIAAEVLFTKPAVGVDNDATQDLPLGMHVPHGMDAVAEAVIHKDHLVLQREAVDDALQVFRDTLDGGQRGVHGVVVAQEDPHLKVAADRAGDHIHRGML